MRFIEFQDYHRIVCIRVDTINGWSDDGMWITVHTDDGKRWDLTPAGSKNFRKIWKELDAAFKG